MATEECTTEKGTSPERGWDNPMKPKRHNYPFNMPLWGRASAGIKSGKGYGFGVYSGRGDERGKGNGWGCKAGSSQENGKRTEEFSGAYCACCDSTGHSFYVPLSMKGIE